MGKKPTLRLRKTPLPPAKATKVSVSGKPISMGKKPTLRLRKTPLPPAKVVAVPVSRKRFDDQASKHSEHALPKQRATKGALPPLPPGRAVVQRGDGTALRRTTVYLNLANFRRLSVYCAEHDIGLSDMIDEAVEALLDARRA